MVLCSHTSYSASSLRSHVSLQVSHQTQCACNAAGMRRQLHLKLPHFMCLPRTIQAIAPSRPACASVVSPSSRSFNLNERLLQIGLWFVCYLCLSRPSISAIHRASITLPCARRSGACVLASWRLPLIKILHSTSPRHACDSTERHVVKPGRAAASTHHGGTAVAGAENRTCILSDVNTSMSTSQAMMVTISSFMFNDGIPLRSWEK